MRGWIGWTGDTKVRWSCRILSDLLIYVFTFTHSDIRVSLWILSKTNSRYFTLNLEIIIITPTTLQWSVTARPRSRADLFKRCEYSLNQGGFEMIDHRGPGGYYVTVTPEKGSSKLTPWVSRERTALSLVPLCVGVTVGGEGRRRSWQFLLKIDSNWPLLVSSYRPAT